MRYAIRPYRHYGECLAIDNGTVECVLSLGFGLRILRFCLCGQENVFFEQPADADYLCTAEGWRVHGGTRLWLAPECVHNDYYPDNAPVQYEILANGARVTQALDAFLQVRKSITVRFTDDPGELAVEYAITNLGDKTIVGAPWAVSMMREGSLLSATYAGAEQGAKPGGSLSLWNKTLLTDPRLTLAEDSITVRQTPSDEYFKLGVLCREGKASCRVAGQTFTKRWKFDADAIYPDNNVNLEIFCCRWMMEFETLAPLCTIAFGEMAKHCERWRVTEAREKREENV